MIKVNLKTTIRLLDLEACESIAKKEKKHNKNFDRRYPGQLESALFSVNFRAESERHKITEIAAAYFVHIACGHCFLDGNKRFSVTFMVYFLNLNDYRLKMDNQELRNLAIEIAHQDTHNISLETKKSYVEFLLSKRLEKIKHPSVPIKKKKRQGSKRRKKR